MTNFPRVQFVSAPDVTAEVRFDFNSVGEWSDYDVWPGHDAFTLGAPGLTGEPGAYGVEYEDRKLTFNLVIEASKVVAAGVMSRLAREIVTRRTNWLLFQLSAFSQPVWFKTYRTAPDDLDFENVIDSNDGDSGDFWGIGVTLEAEPFAYGALVTLPAVTINNDPAAGTNPMRYVLPAIVGDAPAPLKIKASFNVDSMGRRMLFAMTPYNAGAAPASPIVWPIGTGDSWTASTDTGAGVANGSFSGGSYRMCTFATQIARLFRFSGAAPVSVMPGQYRVFFRFARESFLDQFEFTLDQLVGDNWDRAYGPVVQFTRTASTANQHATWADLGTHTFPNGAPEEVLPGGTANVSPTVRLVIAKLYGNFGCMMDSFLLIPVDLVKSEASTVLTSDFIGRGPKTTEYGYWDGDAETFTTYTTSTGALAPAPMPAVGGAFLKVTPGADNVLHWMLQTSLTSAETGDNPDVLTHTSTVTLSYYPRWLNLATA